MPRLVQLAVELARSYTWQVRMFRTNVAQHLITVNPFTGTEPTDVSKVWTRWVPVARPTPSNVIGS